MIDVDVLDSEEADEYASIVNYDPALDEEYGSGLVEAGVTEEVVDMQKDLKSSSLSSYMLKPSNLLTQLFGENMTAQEKIFKHMCNFGAWAEWRKVRRVISSYRGADNTKYQCGLFNPTPLGCIAGYMMYDAVSERALKRLTHRRLSFIDCSISSYCYIINSPKRFEQIRQSNKLESVLCDLESGGIR